MTIQASKTCRIVAIELKSMPRRLPNVPHLYIGLTTLSPDECFEKLQKGKRHPGFQDKWLKVCQEVLEHHEIFTDSKEAKKVLRKEKERLAREGHAINGSASKWHTYVVDLDPTGMTDVGEGYVYVGESSHTPEERYAIHKGDKPKPPAKDLRSKVVHKRGTGLNRKLMAELTPQPPVFTQKDSRALERSWARTLKKMKYRVEAGDATPGRKKAKK